MAEGKGLDVSYEKANGNNDIDNGGEGSDSGEGSWVKPQQYWTKKPVIFIDKTLPVLQKPTQKSVKMTLSSYDLEDVLSHPISHRAVTAFTAFTLRLVHHRKSIV